MITRIDHAHIVARDMDRSIDFYTRALGFRLLRRVAFGPPDARRELAYVGHGAMMLELVQPAHGGAFQGTEARPLGLACEDLAAEIDRLRALGVEIANEPAKSFSFGGRQAVIKDPSGLAIELRQYDSIENPMDPSWYPWRDDVSLVE